MKQEDGGKSGDKSGEKPAADKAKEEGGIAAAAAAALGAAAVKVGFVDGCDNCDMKSRTISLTIPTLK